MLLVAFDNINVDNISVGYRGLYRIQLTGPHSGAHLM